MDHDRLFKELITNFFEEFVGLLLHVENQATPQTDFPKRMFRYFAHLTEKYDLPVCPVVIFSYDAPTRPEPKQYRVAFPDKTVLRFDYTVIQLSRLPWRRFVRQANPVANALMAKMNMATKERPKVKLECLRLLATLNSYLKQTVDEMKQCERQREKMAPGAMARATGAGRIAEVALTSGRPGSPRRRRSAPSSGPW